MRIANRHWTEQDPLFEPHPMLNIALIVMLITDFPFFVAPAFGLFNPAFDLRLFIVQYFMWVSTLITIPLCIYFSVFFFRVVRLLFKNTWYLTSHDIPVCIVRTDPIYPKVPIIRRRSTVADGANPQGYVYLLKSPLGYYKIGKATYPEKRINEIGLLLPFEVERIHLIQCANYNEAERHLHRQYEEKRYKNSEWFALSHDDVATIQAIESM